jgi:hypothetical protein
VHPAGCSADGRVEEQHEMQFSNSSRAAACFPYRSVVSLLDETAHMATLLILIGTVQLRHDSHATAAYDSQKHTCVTSTVAHATVRRIPHRTRCAPPMVGLPSPSPRGQCKRRRRRCMPGVVRKQVGSWWRDRISSRTGACRH